MASSTTNPALTEEFWNAKAADFARSQDLEDSRVVDLTIESLNKHVGLAGQLILDVGAGSGRFGLPLAAHCKRVVLTDVSPRMLEEALHRAEERHITNTEFRVANWMNVDLSLEGWKGAFDLVFASMVPVFAHPEALATMTAASRGWVAITQFTRGDDNISDAIRTGLGDTAADPHNDPQRTADLIELLKAQGHEPIVDTIGFDTEMTYTFDEAVQRYSGRFSSQAQAQGTSVNKLLEPLREQYGDAIPVRRRTEKSIVYWRAQ